MFGPKRQKMNEFSASSVKSTKSEAIKSLVSTKIVDSIKFDAIKRRSESETDSDEIFFDAQESESPKSR